MNVLRRLIERCALRAVLALLAACLAAAGARAEQRMALVIGNASYQDLPLDNPLNDAADMAAVLEEAGFRVILRRDADSRAMRQAVREFAAELRRADVGLFYYAGHGVQLGGTNYLLPVGADIRSEADAEDLSLDVNYVLRTMEESQARVRIVILDACRNNPYPRSFRSAARGLAPVTATSGSLVAFATAPGALAADGTGRNGIYTKHLLASLREVDSEIAKVFQRTRATASSTFARAARHPWPRRRRPHRRRPTLRPPSAPIGTRSRTAGTPPSSRPTSSSFPTAPSPAWRARGCARSSLRRPNVAPQRPLQPRPRHRAACPTAA
jgi:Caspase domain